MTKFISLLCLFALLLTTAAGCSTATENSAADTDTTTITQQVEDATETTTAKKKNEITPQPIPEELAVSFTGFGASSVLNMRNLRTDRAVQQIAIYEEEGVTYLFAAQRINADTYLSRCRLNTEQRTATAIDSVILKDFGHAESMDVSIHNGKLYLFIGCTANPINDYAWSREIMRFCYEKGKITEQKTITDLAYVTPEGELPFSGATPYRITFGMDDEADKIAIYSRVDKNNTGSGIEHRINLYRLSDLHRALDNCDGTLSMKNMASAFLATTGKVSASSICANGSFQGMDLDADGVIWLTGGATNNKPQLSTFVTESKSIRRTKVQDVAYIVSAKLGEKDFRNGNVYVEIESIKYYKGNYYCVFNPAGDLEKNFTEVYLLKNR